jgi:hypothetical protein
MKPFNRKFWAILAAVCFAVACGTSLAANKILATVGGEVITSADLEKSYQIFLRINRITPNTDEARMIKSEVLDNLINGKIIDQESRKLNIMVTPDEVSKAIERMESLQNMTPGELIRSNEELGLPAEDLKKQIRHKLLIDKILFEVVFPAHSSVVHDDELMEVLEQDYPEFINVKAFLLRYEEAALTKRLRKLRVDRLCDATYITNSAGVAPQVINSNLAAIKNIRVKQLILSVQKWPRLLVADEGKQTLALILCKKESVMPDKVLKEIQEKLRNKKLEAYAQHYLANLRKKRDLDIHVTKDF